MRRAVNEYVDEMLRKSDEMLTAQVNEIKKTTDKEIVVVAICWMQGESDASGRIADEYYDNQKRFVSFLREDLNEYADDGKIYFIDAGIQEGTIFPRYEAVNEAKARFASESELNLYFSTIDEHLTTNLEPEGEPDLAHYDSMSELKLGHLFAEYIISSYEKRN